MTGSNTIGLCTSSTEEMQADARRANGSDMRAFRCMD
jgi:hypothetical protein